MDWIGLHFNKMKVICTPLTSNATNLLDLDACPDSLLESISLNQEEYEKLVTSGALAAINSSLGKIIDDYEDEVINTIEALNKTLTILENHLTSENASVMKKLIYLNTLAIKNGTGLFFFF